MKETILKEGIEKSNIITEPFVRKYLSEELEDTDSERLTIRINTEERARIEFLKESLEFASDGTVIKLGLGVLENVIRNTLGVDIIKKISSQTRRRPIK